jgi:tetratricopeptide (TPR) repeat protein
VNRLALVLLGLLAPAIGVAQTSVDQYAQVVATKTRQANEAALAADSQALAKNPHDVEALIRRGSVRSKLGDYAGAIADDTAALALDPKNVVALTNRANARAFEHDFKAAKDDYARALALDPGHVAAFLNRGNVEAMEQNYPAALEDYNAALALDPKNARALYDRAGARRAVGRYADAGADYSQVLLQDPGDVRARLNRAVVRMAQRKWGDATGDLQECLKTLPPERQIYPRLYLWVVGVKQGAGAQATQDLQAHRQQLAPAYATTWPAQLESFCAGQLPEPKLLLDAITAQTKKNKGQFAQACYFAGIRREMTHTPDADRLFQKSVKDGNPRLHEFILAREELKNSGAQSK